MPEVLRHVLGVAVALPTWVAPLLFLPVARRQLDGGGEQRLWRSWMAAVAAFLLFATGAWFLVPDAATTPVPTAVSELVLVAPSLAAVAYFLQESRRSALAPNQRLAIAAMIGMGALLLCFMPAALISSALGGSEMGFGC